MLELAPFRDALGDLPRVQVLPLPFYTSEQDTITFSTSVKTGLSNEPETQRTE